MFMARMIHKTKAAEEFLNFEKIGSDMPFADPLLRRPFRFYHIVNGPARHVSPFVKITKNLLDFHTQPPYL